MSDSRTTVGFAGLGRMGVRMARLLVDAGFDVVVHNRSPAAAQSFTEATGARSASTPRALAEQAPVIVTMVADGPALLALIDGDEGLAAGLSSGQVVIDMGTSGVEHTSRARQRLEACGAELVEAPVSGSVAAAESKSLLVMAAGDPEALQVARPVLDAIAGNVITVGGPRAGAAMKLAVNSVLYGINQAIAESLVLAERAGIERSVAYDVFASSAVAAPVVNYRQAVFVYPGTTPVSFSVDLAIKDLELILELAAAAGTSMPQAETNLSVMTEARGAGLGGADMGDVAVHLRDAHSERQPPSQT